MPYLASQSAVTIWLVSFVFGLSLLGILLIIAAIVDHFDKGPNKGLASAVLVVSGVFGFVLSTLLIATCALNYHSVTAEVTINGQTTKYKNIQDYDDHTNTLQLQNGHVVKLPSNATVELNSVKARKEN